MLRLSTIVALAVALFLARDAAQAQAPFDCAAIDQLIEASEVRVGLVLIDLASGERCAYGEHEQFRTASLYKLFVLAEAYEQEARGHFSFDDEQFTIAFPVRVEQGASDGATSDGDGEGAAATASATAGSRLEFVEEEISGREAVRRMIVLSDNPTAATLHERLGFARVDAAARALGLGGTSLRGDFVTAAADIATFYTLLYDGQLVSARASWEMLELLRAQQVRDLIPALLPDGVEIANKTGLIERVLHDSAIVYAPGGNYILVVMTQWPEGGAVGASYTAIHQLSTFIYDFYAQPQPTGYVRIPAPPRTALALAALDVGASGAPAAPAPAAAAAAAEPAPPAGAAAQAARPAIVPAGGVTASGLWPPPSEALLVVAAMLALLAVVLRVADRRSRRAEAAEAPAREPAGTARPRSPSGGGHDVRVTPPGEPQQGAGWMRFRLRKRSRDAAEQPSTATPALESLQAAVESIPVRQREPEMVYVSPRVERMREYFRAQGQLLREMQDEVERETAPLLELIDQQERSLRTVLDNLEERVRPLTEFADIEDENLAQLQQQLQIEGTDFLTRAFSDYVGAQRDRIAMTREQIASLGDPLRQWGEDQREGVEAALSRLDTDVAALERTLTQQRKVMIRMMDAMRSEAFVTVRDFLLERQAALVVAGEQGTTDPREIGELMQQQRELLDDVSGKQVEAVLRATNAADERLIGAAPVPPRPMLPAAPPEEPRARPKTARRRRSV